MAIMLASLVLASVLPVLSGSGAVRAVGQVVTFRLPGLTFQGMFSA